MGIDRFRMKACCLGDLSQDFFIICHPSYFRCTQIAFMRYHLATIINIVLLTERVRPGKQAQPRAKDVPDPISGNTKQACLSVNIVAPPG